jgi:plastocyanin
MGGTDLSGTTGSGTSAGGATTDPSSSAASAASLTIKQNTVSPGSLTVSPGQKIDITNADSVAHDLIDSKDNIASGAIKAKGSGLLTAPATAGTYRVSDPSTARPNWSWSSTDRASDNHRPQRPGPVHHRPRSNHVGRPRPWSGPEPALATDRIQNHSTFYRFLTVAENGI